MLVSLGDCSEVQFAQVVESHASHVESTARHLSGQYTGTVAGETILLLLDGRCVAMEARGVVVCSSAV